MALYAQKRDPTVEGTALYEAGDTGDVDAALALFAHDAVVKLVVLPPAPHQLDTIIGPEELCAWVEGLLAMNWEGEFVILQVRSCCAVAVS